jgi:hypothetical protein
MRRYVQVSGALFSLVAIAQLTRAIYGWPMQVSTVAIPVWASVVAFVVTGSLAAWSLRVSRGAA